jgi:hypothetical protein
LFSRPRKSGFNSLDPVEIDDFEAITGRDCYHPSDLVAESYHLRSINGEVPAILQAKGERQVLASQNDLVSGHRW